MPFNRLVRRFEMMENPYPPCVEHFQQDNVGNYENMYALSSIWLRPFVICEECGEIILMKMGRGGRYVVSRNNIVSPGVYGCYSCVSSCESCNEVHWNRDLNEDLYCEECVNTSVRCSNCGGAYPRSRMRVNQFISGNEHDFLCVNCYEDTVYCEGCDQRFWRTDDEWAHGQGGYCVSCSRDNYGHRSKIHPDAVMAPDHPKCTYEKGRTWPDDAMEAFYEDVSGVEFNCEWYADDKPMGWKSDVFSIRDNGSIDTIKDAIWELCTEFSYGYCSDQYLYFESTEKTIVKKIEDFRKSLVGLLLPWDVNPNMTWTQSECVQNGIRKFLRDRVDDSGARYTKKMSKVLEKAKDLHEMCKGIINPRTNQRLTNTLGNFLGQRVQKAILKWLTQEKAAETLVTMMYGFDDGIIETVTQFNIDVGSCQYPGNSGSYGWGYGSLYTSDMGLILLYVNDEIIGRSVVRYFYKNGKKYVMPDRLYLKCGYGNNMNQLVNGMFKTIVKMEPDATIIASVTTKHEGSTISDRLQEVGELAIEYNTGLLQSKAFKPIFDTKSPFDGHLPSYYNDSGTYSMALKDEHERIWFVMCIDGYNVVQGVK